MKVAGGLAILFLALCTRVQAAPVLGINAEEPAPTIARLLQERLPAELVPELRAFADTTSLRDALSAGEIDIAFLEEPLEAVPGVTVVAELYPSVLHVLVRDRDAGTALGSLLTSGPVWAGAPGGTGHRLAMQLGTDYGVEEIEILPDPWSEEPRVLPWHPGAQRYIDRELPSFIERYAEFMGATATVTIALVTFGVALYR